MAALDEPFSVPELREVLAAFNGRSAQDPDGISNRLLRNLDDESTTFLMEEINRIWERGVVPESWKLASVVVILKPGRAPDITNLRPISLTSCIGKVAKHVIDNSISKHIEDRGLFPYNLIGFRPSLSTQDAIKLIKYHIIDRNTRDVRAILGLDLEKAFATFSHAHILDSISELGLGQNFDAFISSFLRHRKVTLKLGDLRSEPIELGTRATPQGSVVSLLLFNIATCKFSQRLSEVEGINYTSTPTTLPCGASEAAMVG